MDQNDVERIARAALRELGVTPSTFRVSPAEGQPGTFKVEFGGRTALKVKCSPGSTAQWIREQVFQEYLAQG